MEIYIYLIRLWTITAVNVIGEERSRFMTSAFYRKAVGAFVVTDVTQPNGFESASVWKKDLDLKLRMHDDSLVPCVLLINKVMSVPGQLVFIAVVFWREYVDVAVWRDAERENKWFDRQRTDSSPSRSILSPWKVCRMVWHLGKIRHQYQRSSSIPRGKGNTYFEIECFNQWRWFFFCARFWLAKRVKLVQRMIKNLPWYWNSIGPSQLANDIDVENINDSTCCAKMTQRKNDQLIRL